METKLNEAINQKLLLLVDFILEKNSNVDKTLINHKINELFQIKNKVVNNIIDTIIQQRPIIKVKKSIFSNYILTVDNDDHYYDDLKINKFVMNITTQNIIGIENSNGEIETLTKSLIEICHKYKIKYDIPLNLNSDHNLDQDIVIVNEIQELGLNYTESDEEDINID